MPRDTGSGNDPVLRAYAEAEDRADRIRRNNRIRQFNAELAEHEAQQAADAAALKRERALAREAALAEALGRQKMSDMRTEKEVQRIREEAPELRELRSKLALAQMNQQREMQIVQAMEQAEHSKVRNQVEDAQIEQARQKAVIQEDEKEAKRKAGLRRQKAVIEQQMEEREYAKLAAYQEFLREKKMVDDIVAKIQEEDTRDRHAHLEKQKQTRQYISQYLKDREDFKRQEKARAEAEDQEILRFMAEQNKRKEDMRSENNAKEIQKQKMLAEQSAKIEGERRRKEEMEDILIEYYQELREEADRKAEQDRVEKRLRDRIAMIEANEYQKSIKAARVEDEKREEEEFRRVMMEKFAEDDRIEQMNAMKRNQKRAEHNREVQRLIEARREMREAERQREVDEINLARKREDRRQEIIEQERQRLLQEHAGALAAYLPKGVLQERDLERLGIDPSKAGTGCSMPSFK
mmetsp:Transcript_127981/g.221149  ORF Transcript_127981/g.221149 Transcript_127981/m.221149 type:complete len:466 (-) Transcript_127981:995-2392(-)